MDYRDDSGHSVSPIDDLKVNLNLYAVVRSFQILIEDLGVPGLNVTLWTSNMTVRSNVVETRDIDGIAISKYIRSLSYSRIMTGSSRT